MACSYMWVYTVCLALCIHLMNAKRVELADSNDGLFCECKEANSQSECNYWRKFYHPEEKKCCRMSKEKSMFNKAAFWKSKYVRQNDQDKERLCLEEKRPFKKDACCTVAGSAKFFGESMRIPLSYAKIYSMAHSEMNGQKKEMKEEDYRKKSKIVIEMADVSSGTVDYLRNKIPADKIKEGLKQLQQKDQLLQCEEDFIEVEQGVRCQVRKQPICCCNQTSLDLNVKQEVGAPRCIPQKCAPTTDRFDLEGKLESFVGHLGYVKNKVKWDYFSPFQKCPASFGWKGLTFVKKDLSEQLTGHQYGQCKRAQTTTYWDRSWEPPRLKERAWCIKKSYSSRCKAGKVLYTFFRGHTLKDAVLCPSDYKSNLPGDRFDSRCDCGDVEKVQDYLNPWDHGTGEVEGSNLEWIYK